MKWVSMVAVCAFFFGIVLLGTGRDSIDIKAESREALIISGLLVCSISCLWLAAHAVIALIRTLMHGKPPEANQQ